MSSFNDFHDNVKRNAMTVSIINCATSFYLGFAIFTIVGFLAKQYSIPLDKIVDSGSSLVFIVYPTGLAQLPVSPLWSCIFFLMMYIVGVGSMIGCFETVMAPLSDKFELLQRNQLKFRIIACVVGYCLCIPMMCNGGMHLLDLLNTYGGGVNLLILAIFELIALSYVYGVHRLAEDIDMMRDARVRNQTSNNNASETAPTKRSKVWIVFWKYLTLIYLLFVSVLWIISYSGTTGKTGEPAWAVGLGWFFSAMTLIPLPIVALIVWCRMGDSGVAAILSTKPMPMWGPILPENRTGRYQEEEKRRSESNLLDFVETRAFKNDRMKRAKEMRGRFSTSSPQRTMDFELSNDGTGLVRHPTKTALKKTVVKEQEPKDDL